MAENQKHQISWKLYVRHFKYSLPLHGRTFPSNLNDYIISYLFLYLVLGDELTTAIIFLHGP